MAFVLEVERWHPTHTTITWSIATLNFSGQPGGSFSSSISNPIVLNDIANAFSQWDAASGLSFIQVADAANVDIRLGYGPIDGVGNTIGRTNYRFDGNHYFMTGITIRFDSGENYFTQGSEVYVNNTNSPITGLALHEIGHALGLDHINSEPAVMNSAPGTNITLRPSDIQGIQFLYGPGGPVAHLAAPAGGILASGNDFTGNGSGDFLLQQENGPTNDFLVFEMSANAVQAVRSLGTLGADWVVGGGNSGGDAEGDTLVNIEDLAGSRYDDELFGNDQANLLWGMEGNDVINGVNYTLGDHVENLVLAGAGGLSGTGNDLDNAIVGNDYDNLLNGGGGVDTLKGLGGADIIDGGTGADTMYGGDGYDIFIVDDAGDVVTEAIGEGFDMVQTRRELQPRGRVRSRGAVCRPGHYGRDRSDRQTDPSDRDYPDGPRG